MHFMGEKAKGIESKFQTFDTKMSFWADLKKTDQGKLRTDHYMATAAPPHNSTVTSLTNFNIQRPTIVFGNLA